MPDLLWIDFESTGLEPDCTILEIGAIVTDDTTALVEKASFVKLIRPKHIDMMALDPLVLEMHAKSHLWRDLNITGSNVYTTYMMFRGWIEKQFGLDGRITLAGSGISHFDRRIIQRDMPWLETRLNYWNMDISIAMRWMAMTGVELRGPKEDIPHRALADVRRHINTARRFLAWVEANKPREQFKRYNEHLIAEIRVKTGMSRQEVIDAFKDIYAEQER